MILRIKRMPLKIKTMILKLFCSERKQNECCIGLKGGRENSFILKNQEIKSV